MALMDQRDHFAVKETLHSSAPADCYRWQQYMVREEPTVHVGESVKRMTRPVDYYLERLGER